MTLQKISWDNKTNLFPFVNRTRQVCAEDLNELKSKFNANVDEFISPNTEDFDITGDLGAYEMKLKDRPNTSGITGYKIIRLDFDFSNIPYGHANSIWEIRYPHDLSAAEVVIPEGVTLLFIGGSLSNYTSITGDRTKIISGLNQIFDGSGSLLGTWNVERVFPQWFGAVGDGVADDTIAIQNALSLGGECYLKDGLYMLSEITLSVPNTCLKLSNNAQINCIGSFSTAIYVTAENCIVDGGTINMHAVMHAENVEWDYAGIYITGNNVKIKNVTITDVNKVGIGFKGVNNCYAENCIIHGNFGLYDYNGIDISHFGIAFDPGGNIGEGGIFVARNNTITGCVQGIYFHNYGSATDEHGIIITGNNISNCFKHAINCDGGEGPVISDNNLSYCSIAISVKCPNGAIVSNNMVYLGKVNDVSTDEAGILLVDPIGAVCTGNNIKGNGIEGLAALVLTNVDGDSISDNIITGNIIKITATAETDALQLGNNASTYTMTNNILSDNIIDSSCAEGHGAIYVRANVSCISYNNIISRNTVTINVINTGASGIYNYNIGGLLIKENNIIIKGNSASEISAYGIYSVSTAEFIGEIVDNKISAYSGNADNFNITGVKVVAGTGILQIEANKVDASTSDALTYVAVDNENANAIVKKNINDIRVPSSGVFTILSGQLSATLPDGNFQYLEAGATDYISNMLIRPINPNAIDFMISHKITPSNYGGNPVVIVDIPAPAADLLFAWEII